MNGIFNQGDSCSIHACELEFGWFDDRKYGGHNDVGPWKYPTYFHQSTNQTALADSVNF